MKINYNLASFANVSFLTLLFAFSMASTLRAQTVRDSVSYSHDIKPLVESFCTTCHAGDDPEGDFVLTSYSDVRQQTEHGKLLERINDSEDPMPEDGLMPQYLRRLFQLWAEGGYVKQGKTQPSRPRPSQFETFKPPTLKPVDINTGGFDLLQNMQGHWVGSLYLMGTDYEWWAFDYRAISPSHVHGIYEGGTIGNLFTSFFVTEFLGTRTIMARNGGILNGIYRTSYFVLDQVKKGGGKSTYRLVDAYGGKDIMWLELTFSGNQLEFDAYTSRFGLSGHPKKHMSFKARRHHTDLAAKAARQVGFPKNVIDFTLPPDFPKSDWGSEVPQTSATYMWQEAGRSIEELGRLANDPYRIEQMPHVASLSVTVERTATTRGKKLLLYLSREALTDRRGKFRTRFGYLREELLNGLLSFPEIASNRNSFKFTYLHPGDYYLTVVADMDGDGFPGPGDISHAVRPITVGPKSHTKVRISNLLTRN